MSLILIVFLFLCSCWLSGISLYATLVCPAGIILLYNFLLFFLIIYHLNTMKNRKIFEHKTRKIRAFGIIGFFFLFGLLWSLPIFSVSEVAEVFTYLFNILITFQGIFIFILYCICKKDIRQIIYLQICHRKKGAPRNVTNDKSKYKMIFLIFMLKKNQCQYFHDNHNTSQTFEEQTS